MNRAGVLFVDHATALGGAQHCLLLLLEQLDRACFTPHLAAPPGLLATAAERLGVHVHSVPLRRLRHEPLGPWRLMRDAAALARIIRREQIAIVHHNTMRASFYATLAAGLSGRPVVWHVHDIFPRGAYVRAMCRLSTAAIAVSAAIATPLPCRDKVRIIPNGVRLADFAADRRAAAAQMRAAWAVPATATVIGHVARLQPWKGQRDVIAAAEAVLSDGSDAYFVFVGGDIFGDAGAYERELKTRVAQRGLGARVIFAGHQTDIAAALQALDILVHASVNEPFGRILIEAGAAGVPVVAYAGGGVPEIITHERTGLLVPPGDHAGLAAALRRVLTDRALARRLGAAARADAAARFDVRRLTRAVEEVLRAAVGHSRPAAKHQRAFGQ